MHPFIAKNRNILFYPMRGPDLGGIFFLWHIHHGVDTSSLLASKSKIYLELNCRNCILSYQQKRRGSGIFLTSVICRKYTKYKYRFKDLKKKIHGFNILLLHGIKYTND